MLPFGQMPAGGNHPAGAKGSSSGNRPSFGGMPPVGMPMPGMPGQLPRPSMPRPPIASGGFGAPLGNNMQGAGGAMGMAMSAPGFTAPLNFREMPPPLIPAITSATKPPQPPAIKQCPLHAKKPKPKCKFCTQYMDGQQAQADWEKKCLELDMHPEAPIITNPNHLLPMTNNTTFNMSSMLKDQVLASLYFKSLLGFAPPTRVTANQTLQTRPPLSFQELLDILYQKVEAVEPYTQHSATDPSTFLCILYRFFTTGLTENQLLTLLKHPDSPYIRIAGYLFVRFVLHADWLLKYCEPLLYDDELFQPHKDSTRQQLTVGDFVEETLQSGKLFEISMPRLGGAKQSQLVKFIAKAPVLRLRMDANVKALNEYMPKSPVEVLNVDCEWEEGVVVSVVTDDENDAYKGVMVHTIRGIEQYPLSRIILADPSGSTEDATKTAKSAPPDAKEKDAAYSSWKASTRDRGSDRRWRSRSRSRSGGRRGRDDEEKSRPTIDWTRNRGDDIDSYHDLITQQKERVFAQGREYQTRTGPSMRLATLSDGYRGSHSQRLAEEETLTRRRQETMQQLNRQRNQDERDRKEQKARDERDRIEKNKSQVIEKYTSNTRKTDSSKGGSRESGSDIMRLG